MFNFYCEFYKKSFFQRENNEKVEKGVIHMQEENACKGEQRVILIWFECEVRRLNRALFY